MKIKFKKLFQYVDKEGMYTNAIILVGNQPYIFHTSGHTQYCRMLVIDLWLVTIKFTWISRKIKTHGQSI